MLGHSLALLAVFSATCSASYSFISVGDWGGAAINEQDYSNVYAVSAQMATTASELGAQFIIGTGDNFYWCGIQNTSDYQINEDFLEPYDAESLQVKWYQTLGVRNLICDALVAAAPWGLYTTRHKSNFAFGGWGRAVTMQCHSVQNHEYGYNVQAQIDYTKINSIWFLPSRYYTQRLQLSSSVYMTLIVLDTSPCVSDYRGDDQDEWDPCSTEYPTCSLDDTNDDFEGPCMFHQNILSQNCFTQYNWLQNTLSGVPANDWLVVVGHHPIDECDVVDFASLLQQHGFSLYLNGHAHTLTQYTIDHTGAYITTGAGALVNTADQQHFLTKLRVSGKDITPEMRKVDSSLGASHSYQTVFNQKVAGFTSHTFSSDFSSLSTNFISYTGDILHTFVVNRLGQVIG